MIPRIKQTKGHVLHVSKLKRARNTLIMRCFENSLEQRNRHVSLVIDFALTHPVTGVLYKLNAFSITSLCFIKGSAFPSQAIPWDPEKKIKRTPPPHPVGSNLTRIYPVGSISLLPSPVPTHHYCNAKEYKCMNIEKREIINTFS